MDFNGKGLFAGGEVAEVVSENQLLVWLILYNIIVFLHVKGTCAVVREMWHW